MRAPRCFFAALAVTCSFAVSAVAQPAASAPSTEEARLREVLTEALSHGEAFENLRALVTLAPGRLAGSPALDRAVVWGTQTLTALKLDRVYQQDVMVPHWERGAKESVMLLPPAGAKGEAAALNALA